MEYSRASGTDSGVCVDFTVHCKICKQWLWKFYVLKNVLLYIVWGFFFNDKEKFCTYSGINRTSSLFFVAYWTHFPEKTESCRSGSAYVWHPPGLRNFMSFFILHKNDDPFLHMTTYLFFKCLDSKSTPSIFKSNLVFHSSVLRDFDVNSTNCIQKPHESRWAL